MRSFLSGCGKKVSVCHWEQRSQEAGFRSQVTGIGDESKTITLKAGQLASISHHIWTFLVGCRKGGASAPTESRLPPSVGPVPRAVPRLRDCAGHGTQE